jgi:hypothetical protein
LAPQHHVCCEVRLTTLLWQPCPIEVPDKINHYVSLDAETSAVFQMHIMPETQEEGKRDVSEFSQ